MRGAQYFIGEFYNADEVFITGTMGELLHPFMKLTEE